jgi:V8-like Glu-specific endopeptidase
LRLPFEEINNEIGLRAGICNQKDFSMKKLLLLSLLSLQFLNSISWAEENKKEDLYSQLNRAIIRLEHIEIIHQEGSAKIITKNKPDGTGFFVMSEGKLFVVSARHVVEQPYDLHARVECINNISNQKEVILLKLKRNNWVFHPKHADKDSHYVDVAAMRIKWIKDRSVKNFSYRQKDSEKNDKNHFPENDPVPPRRILVFGFPMDIGFDLLEQRPFGRSGIISMQTGKKFLKVNINGENKLAEERCYVIDAETFPGNSGSPIINQTSFTDRKLQLLGLISASNLKMDFAIAEPVSRIRETIDLAKDQNVENLNCWLPVGNK